MPKFRAELTAIILEEAFMIEEQDLFPKIASKDNDDNESDSDFVRVMN